MILIILQYLWHGVFTEIFIVIFFVNAKVI
jgi:hypothetical protein